MKKLVIAIFAVACMVMFVAPSYADDRVSFSGSMRVRAWANDYNTGAEDSYFDQRFRLGTKVTLGDDVYVELRADFGEATWGDGYTGGTVTRPRKTATSTLDLDRGYININKEMWSLRVGQQYMGLGILEVLDANATGAILKLKLPVAVSLMYAKISENGSLNDDGANDDNDLYGINVGYDADAFSANVFVAMADDSATDNNPIMFGVHGKAGLGMVNLTGELAMAGGDDGAGTDYVGAQFYLRADANISDALSAGAEILYAMGSDKAGEAQLTTLSDWWSFVPMASNTPFDADWSAVNSNPFDPTFSNGGVQGITAFAKFQAMEALSLGGKVGYFTPQEDANTATDSITSFNVWVSYALATNTYFDVAYLYSDYDNLNDTYSTLVARLQVNF
jgi:hypothetical protein